MRTTIDLPDELIRAARVRAAATDESLKELFTRALTKELGRPVGRTRRELPVIGLPRSDRSSITPAELEQVLSNDDIDHDIP